MVDYSNETSYDTSIENNLDVALHNPFRYRGYYYDKETKLYYLNSRYYDAELGRFINIDDINILDTTKDFVNGLNLYIYCLNNPVNDFDADGYWSWKKFWEALGMLFTAVVAVVVSVATLGLGIPILMGVVAGVTLAAGILTGINGIATMIEAGTNYNFVRDFVFQGNEMAYEIYSGITEGIAIIGTAVLGVYQSTGQFKAAKIGRDFLGKGYTKVDTRRWISQDGFKQLRWDKFGHGRYGPHFNLEVWEFSLISSKRNKILTNIH